MILHSVFIRATLCLLLACVPHMGSAQNRFSPAIIVDDSVVTNYELNQRIKLLTFFNTSGNLKALAQKQLIEDRLKTTAMESDNFITSDSQVETALESFAARANLDVSQLQAELAQQGISAQTLKDFVKIGVSWRNYIRDNYGPQTAVSAADIDRAIAQTINGSSAIEILLSEIIIPIAPPQITQDMATQEAEKTAKLRSFEAFSHQAKRVSALPSRENGGRLGWRPLANYPPSIRGILRDLDIGEVTRPIPIPNGIALFQKRGLREASKTANVPNETDYAILSWSGATQQTLMEMSQRVDSCNDLYGEAHKDSSIDLIRETALNTQLPKALALELARLDPDEISLTFQDGKTSEPKLVMLCARTTKSSEDVDRAGVENQLRSRNLSSFAASHLERLRTSATIVFQ